MYPHLHSLVVAQVELGVAVYAAGVAGGEVGKLQRHRLLVELYDLCLAGVTYTGHARRKNVVHRFAGGVLLYVHHRNIELTLGGSIAAVVEVEIVGAPFAAHEFESGET